MMNFAVSDLLYLVEQVNSRLQSNKARVADHKARFNIHVATFTGADVVNWWIDEAIDPFKCLYCGTDLFGTSWVLEHAISMSKGGPHCVGNLFPSCGSCNNSKSNRPFKEFMGPERLRKFYNRHDILNKAQEKKRVKARFSEPEPANCGGFYTLKQTFGILVGDCI